MKPYACPCCGALHDEAAAAGGDESRPGPGDTTLCIKCGEWAIFLEDLSLRAPTDDEQLEISHDPICIAVRKSWQQVKDAEANAEPV